MKKKLLALFLCCVMVFSLVPVALTMAFENGNGLQIYGSNGAVAETVLLKRTDKMELTAVAETGSGNYQWQIHVSGDVWANIIGTSGNTLELSYGLVANLLNGDAAEIRCKLTNDVGNVSYSDIVTVQIQPDSTARRAPAASPAVGTVISEAQPIGEPVIVPADAPSYYSAPAAVESDADAEPAPASSDAAADGNDDPAPANDVPANDAPASDPAPANDTPASDVPVNDPAPVNDIPANDVPADETPANDTPTPTTYTILINYIFADGKQAAPSWSAQVAAGSTYTQDIQSPVVVGYTPDYTVVHVEASEAKTYTVTYQPAEVEFTVKHYQQNVSNDEYTLADTETKKGFTESSVGEGLAKTDYTGFYSLLYDTTTTIAADGSTVVEVYYDRYYYLMNFDLDGGYGVEPIYARFGAPISVDTPTKPGYTFAGWDKTIPTTMPAKNETYAANWTVGDSTKVTVVIWGENADDEEYSYIKSSEIQAKPGTTLTKDDLTHILTCGKEEHQHTNSCMNCAHTHTSACYGAIKQEQPVDGKTGSATENINQFKALTGGTLKNGMVYRVKCDGATTTKGYDKYYLYYDNTWYLVSSSNISGSAVASSKEVNAHKHRGNAFTGNNKDRFWVYNSKLSCVHTHTDSCYICGKAVHKHNANCYTSPLDMDATLWKLVKSDEVTVAADGTSIINVYYDRVEFTLHFRDAYSSNDDYGTITKKWGANIREAFNQKCKSAGTSNWSEKSNAAGPWTTYLDIMPTEGRTYYANTEGYGTSTAYYYVEGLDGKDKLFYENKSTGTGYTVTEEEFIEISGFTFNPDRSSKVDDDFDGAKFYYTRNSYNLKFYNYNGEIEGSSKTVKYEAPLSGYNFTPDYPAGLEPNAYVFDGWYTTAGCYEGSKADLNTMTMPASDVILYAKWTPKTHTVKTYLTKVEMDEGKAPTNIWPAVPHGTAVTNPPADPTRDPYKFVGWFYISDTGEEKAFDFSMPVNRDLNLYAKWSSNTLMNFEVGYELEDGTEIAQPFTGSALAGSTKTFNAKTGTQLNKDYQSGYFPKVSSHSITIDIADASKNKYTFVYVAKDEVEYTVRYLDKATGEPVVVDGVPTPDKVVKTRDAVVTETFKQITGYAPDAYQKQLVLAAENNEIIFWYVKDDAHAPVRIIHWQQNLEGDGYTERQSSTNLNGVIGTEYSEEPLEIAGFRYNGTKSNANGTLTAEGLVLNLYYDRIEYPYEFRFVEKDSDPEKQLAESVTGTARYQKLVTQRAKDIPGYTLVSAENQSINIAIEDGTTAVKNVKTFYYTEQTVDIKYEVVGPDGCGTLDNYQDAQLKVTTGEVNGSTPTANDGFKFVGWYKDKSCTEPVDADWVKDSKLTPDKTKNYGTAEKPVMGYEAATYHAKFEYDVADLTITKQGCENIDEGQSFIFDVTGPNGYSKRVVINGNASVTIKGLKIGAYTVTEVTNWSWRYTADSNSQSIDLKPAMSNTVNFTNTRSNHKWLGGDAYSKNIFGN